MNNSKEITRKLVKRNKYTVMAMIIFFILLVVFFIGYKIFFPNNGKPLYGNRLDGIEEVDFTKDELSKIVNSIKEKEFVTNVTTHESGKTLNIIVTVKDGTKSDDAKKITENVTKNVTTAQAKYFDIQIFINNENDKATGYPIIAYKNKTAKEFSFSENK